MGGSRELQPANDGGYGRCAVGASVSAGQPWRRIRDSNWLRTRVVLRALDVLEPAAQRDILRRVDLESQDLCRLVKFAVVLD